ncbi:probable mediator of RNA polymerase II transcription subunit 26c [Phalaenopsis equestris]|uniref:probable mediator of RNA polymerase II transcription subunit 26c n=1 Tax=Phalaenopsis equestris TaxID=78828 RepID=UPI0009E44178|nr:probable mediator of RNA polymerase II transcription subunit 26c [Phalaenopsis equestris]
MDPEELRSVLRSTGVDLWTLIETAIAVAAAEHGRELRARRDGIVERLYSMADGRCLSCDGKMVGSRSKRSSSPGEERKASKGKEEEVGEQEDVEEEEEEERDYRAIDDEQSKILAIKDFLDDQDQSEDSLVSLLQNLADMDITFKSLKETDIGRHVNGLRKHPSSEVKRLVKQLVRKWKETVDEWVKLNSANDNSSPAIITDGDSPQQMPAKNNQNGHQTPDLTCSPNPHAQNGSWQHDRNNLESVEHKARPALRREAPPKPTNSTPSAIAKMKEKDGLLDPDRLASARKRLHDNYQEAQNARKQRTIQVMDIHEIPKPKNAFFARNKGVFQAKH